MGLWSKKTTSQKLIEDDIDVLRKRLDKLSKSLYNHQEEKSMAIIKEMLSIRRSVEVLDLGLARTQSELDQRRGRLSCITDVINWIEKIIQDEREYLKSEGKKPRGVKKVERASSAANW